MSKPRSTRDIAEKYVREQLAIMDGTTEAGVMLIGTARFQALILEIEEVLIKASGGRSRRKHGD